MSNILVSALALAVAVGVVVTIFIGLPGLAVTLPLAIVLFLVLRARQSATRVDPRYLGGAQPDQPGVADAAQAHGRQDPSA